MTMVKICGITTEPALDAAIDAGADYVGLVHYAKSPRHLEIPAAAVLASRARERDKAKVVVLLVDPEDALVDRVVAEINPHILQLHGSETLERVMQIGARADREIIKAVKVATQADVEASLPYLEPSIRADILLFDAMPPKTAEALPGGNGLAFDWRILEAVSARIPFALAGGLTPDNVGEAIQLTGAAIVDVSSGVETRPGEKDIALIRRFLQAAKGAKQSPDFNGPTGVEA
jgi:phosphoribosylanthranilate isomerase